MSAAASGLSWSDVQGIVTLPLFQLGAAPVTLARVAGLLTIVLGVWWLASLMERGLHRLAQSRGMQGDAAASVYAWSRVARYTVWIIGTIVGLNYVGVDLTSFALIGGAVGIGVGFGLQNIFSNFISGIIILLEKTLKIGDFVDLQSGVRGHVREIGLRYTRITTNDAVDIIVPNSEFINGRVTNWTYDNQFRRLRIPFGVAYGVDKERVRDAALKAAARVDGNVSDQARHPDVWLVGLGDSSLNFELVVWVGPERVARPGNTHAAYLWAIEDELRAAGIEIPYPQRDLHLRSGTLNVKLENGAEGAAASTVSISRQP
ncbi:MAG: mechanosensitive ion channel domain-containing protein [Betaproteobacteria bacterium]